MALTSPTTLSRIALLALTALTLACRSAGSARDALVRATLAPTSHADALELRRRARMASSSVSFYRASIALFRRDWDDPSVGLSASRFALDEPMPFGVGDPHVENFGTLLASDGTVTFEPDDLDAAERVPYLWDLRRLAVSLVIAARESNRDAPAARRAAAQAATDIAREAVRAYALTLTETATNTANRDGAIIEDLVRRSNEDTPRRGELEELTTLVTDARSLRRGALDPRDPSRQLTDVSNATRDELTAVLARYRTSLHDPPDAAFFTVLDAARALGRGAASLHRARLLVLVRGPSDGPDDDVILEVKELPAAPFATLDSDAARVLEARDWLWTRRDADPLWGVARLRRCSLQIRTESAAARGVRVSRLRGPLGTPDALRELARSLGARLARIHRRSLPSPPPQAALIASDPDGFAREQVEVSTRYADVVRSDWRGFRRVVRESAARPSPSVADDRGGCELFGAP